LAVFVVSLKKAKDFFAKCPRSGKLLAPTNRRGGEGAASGLNGAPLSPCPGAASRPGKAARQKLGGLELAPRLVRNGSGRDLDEEYEYSAFINFYQFTIGEGGRRRYAVGQPNAAAIFSSDTCFDVLYFNLCEHLIVLSWSIRF